METIRTYLENMFRSLPQTDEVLRIKEDLYCNMEEKYNELKSMGKSENEAIGIVISEFGNIDELTSELGINNNSMQSTVDSTECINVSLSEAKDYLKFKKSSSLKVALGVVICILAVVLEVILSSIAKNRFSFDITKIKFAQNISAVPFFIMIACAVGLFIYSGFNKHKYEYLKKPFNLSPEAYKYVNSNNEAFRKRYSVSIIMGVILCILALIPPIMTDAISGSNHMAENLGASLFLSMIALAVFLFVYFGNIKSGYSVLLQIGDHTKEKKKSDKVIDIVASIVFPLATVIYLIISFVTKDWRYTWIIWPVTGILFGIFSSVYRSINELNSSDKKNVR